MARPRAIVAPHWRSMEELFAEDDLARLRDICEVVWARDEPIGGEELSALLPTASFLIAARPELTTDVIEASPHLRGIVEVAGSFPPTIDYAACARRGIEVLSCAPAFRHVVAEMAVAMALSGARGLVAEHERFREGREHWLADNAGTDFSLFGARVGFVGFGSIAREIARLLAPMDLRIKAYDPWVNEATAARHGATLAPLAEVMAHARCLFVAAAPTPQNEGIVDRAALSLMPKGGLVVLISRAHLVDFDALVAFVRDGSLRLATDVYPKEPLEANHELRTLPGAILSPHRGAAVRGGRQLIGRMAIADIARMIDGKAPESLQRAQKTPANARTGTGDLAR